MVPGILTIVAVILPTILGAIAPKFVLVGHPFYLSVSFIE